MQENMRALIVQAQLEPPDALRRALKEQSIAISTARTCAEAALILWSDCPPQLVFTELQLADGNWASILTLSSKATEHVNVIVMAPFVDIGLYVHTIERGAFDFIVPPYADPELWHVVRIAAENSTTRRRKQATTLPARPRVTSVRHESLHHDRALAAAED
jgi:DNA-binding NtrC family response regulator